MALPMLAFKSSTVSGLLEEYISLTMLYRKCSNALKSQSLSAQNFDYLNALQTLDAINEWQVVPSIY